MQLSHQVTGHWKDETVGEVGETGKWLSIILDECAYKKYSGESTGGDVRINAQDSENE